MITVSRLFVPFQLAAAVGIIYTTPVNTKVMIKKLTFTNTDTVARTITLHIVTGGGAVAADDMLWDAVQIAPGQTKECFEAEGHVLEGSNSAGTPDTLRAFADVAAKVTAMGSGLVITQ